ncbi:MAG: DUF4258 domain-containing protein [Bacteroidia bacterium]|nr:DUF4258 domain-containing protein [Bacteroidia bacterium]
MSFLKRLGYYLIGLSIGLIFLALFLKKKSEETGTSFCYFPNCRVLKELRSKPLSLTKINATTTVVLDSIQIKKFLEDGKVDFKASDTKADPCGLYVINLKGEVNPAQITVENCRDSVSVLCYK